MAKKKRPKLETPPSTAPEKWRGVEAEHWQTQGGKWAAPQHYMCTYMAMFPPELPHYFIQRFTKPGDTVLDPFSGRGTTAVEASAQGRIGIGNDLNPLAVALSRGKISNPKVEEVLERLFELRDNYEASKYDVSKEPDRIQMIYHENTLKQLCYMKEHLSWDEQGVDAFLVSVLMGAMHGQSSGFLSVSMPNTFSMGWNYVRKYIDEKGLECPDRDVFEVLEGRIRRYLKKGYLQGTGEIIEGDVRNLDKVVDHHSVQLLFTSPPYLKVIKYGLYNWIRLWFLTDSGSHEEVDEKLDDTHAINEYLDFMKDSLTATLPLLDKERGLSCWAIGDVKGQNLAWAVWHHVGQHIFIKDDDGVEYGYKLIAIVEDKIPDNQKVTKMWKTLVHHVEYIDEDEEIVEGLGKFESENDAKMLLKDAKEKDGLTLRIRTEKTNDKSGKATPTDRILILKPEMANPVPFLEPTDLLWQPFHKSWKEQVGSLLDAWDKKYMVISLDVDGMMSAAFLSTKYPEARLGGYYTEKGELFSFGEMSVADAKKALWVDLDIFDKEIKSIGQHLIQMTVMDSLPRHPCSFNPNEFFQQAMYHFDKRTPTKFRQASCWTNSPNKWQHCDKYPFATLHILMEFFSEEWPDNGEALQMVLHPDSVWATTYAYALNTDKWTRKMFRSEFWEERTGRNYFADPAMIRARENLIGKLANWCSKQGQGKALAPTVTSMLHEDKLHTQAIEHLLGYQSFKGTAKTKPTKEQNINQFLEYLSSVMKWDIHFAGKTDFGSEKKLGVGTTEKFANPQDFQKIDHQPNWQKFVKIKNIFSGVIKGSRDRDLRYTHNFTWADDKQPSLFDFHGEK